MNAEELNERVKILAENDVISFRAADLAKQAFRQLQEKLQTEDIPNSEMLFTHLATAITRIERGEEIGAPMSGILEEIKTSKFYPDALHQIGRIEELHRDALPKEEWDYLLIHYTTVLQQFEGGMKE